MRSQVMTLAHALKKQGLSFSEAIKRAWKVVRIKLAMLTQAVEFAYLKEDGTIRQATGYFGAAPATTNAETKPATGLAIRYYDTTCNGWRSFRAERLLLA